MKIVLTHVANFASCKDIYLYVSTKEEDCYYEKMFGLKKNEKSLMVRCRKEKSVDGSYPYKAFIEGSIYDTNGEVAVVPNGTFRNNDLAEINTWINEHEEEWFNS